MSKMRILIIEDDVIYATKLEIFLLELGYEVISVVDTISEGIKQFYATNPDVLIIDISLEGKYDGIKLAEKINSDQVNAKPFIFLTASEDNETFLKAKMTSPSAFLLKPFEKKSLQFAIEIAFQNFSNNAQPKNTSLDSTIFVKDNIFIKKDKRIIKISISDVLYIKVEAKYSMIYTISESYILRISLKEILSLITTEYIIRVHRKFLVNSNKIAEFDLENNVMIVGDKHIPIGSSYKKWVIDKLVYLK
jgi:DNA-binding LytR/AlgR family response regulator